MKLAAVLTVVFGLFICGSYADPEEEKRSMAVGRQEFRPGKRFVSQTGDGGLDDVLKRTMALGRYNFRPGKRSMALGRLQFRPGKRSAALGRLNFRPGKRSMALGRYNFRPGKRSMALGRFNFRPGKRSLYLPKTCGAGELEEVGNAISDLLQLLEEYTAYVDECTDATVATELGEKAKTP